MEAIGNLMGPPQLLALAAALGWASGIRLYATVFLVGMAGFMCFVEFFADKIPFVDSVWDVVHTVIRIPAGAALAAGALGADSQSMGWIAAILGGSLAATSHVAKLTTRAAVNTSPEPFSNVAVSLFEDGFVVFMLWLSATHPVLFAIALVVTLLFAIVLMVVLVKFLKLVIGRLRSFLSGRALTQGRS